MTRSYSDRYDQVGAVLAGSGLDQVIVCAQCGEPLETPVEREHCPGAAALALACREEAAAWSALDAAVAKLEYAHHLERMAQFEVNMNFLDRAHLLSVFSFNHTLALIFLTYATIFAGLYFR